MAHPVLAIFRRRLFTFLAILSLLLCLATVALWVRSYWRWDDLGHYSADAQSSTVYWSQSNYAELAFGVERETPPHENWLKRRGNLFAGPAAADGTYRKRMKYGQDPPQKSVVDFYFGYFREETPPGFAPPDKSGYTIWFPHWFLALLFAILPTIRLVSLLRAHRRHRAGLCRHCGYDLRATPDRCPECGHVIQTLPAHVNGSTNSLTPG